MLVAKRSPGGDPHESTSLTVRDLLAPQAGSLKLELIAGRKWLDRSIEDSRVERFYLSLSSEAEAPTEGSVQLIGSRGLSALDAIPKRRRRELLGRLGAAPAVFIVMDGVAVPPSLVNMARRCQTPLLRTSLSSSVATRRIRRFVDKMTLRHEILHGVLVDIYGLGTLIIGESGIGKSESALELIERGHRLVSDDIIEIYLKAESDSPGPNLMGRSPNLTRYFMELRGLGVINVKDLFGPNSIRTSKSVDLVIRLERWEKATEIERLGLDEESYEILGSQRPLIRMPVGPGRNLAMLIEVAARNHLLKQAGHHPARRLMKKVSALAQRRGRNQ